MADNEDDFRSLRLPSDVPLPAGFGGDGESRVIDLGDADDPDEGEMVDGALKIEIDDNGSIEIDFSPPPKQTALPTGEFDENLALHIAPGLLMSIGADLLNAIEQDDQSRQEWLTTRAAGVDLLGFQMEAAKTDTGSAAPLEGMSTVRHPLLAEAVIRFQSNASAELLPASGPVKVRNDSTPQPVDQSGQPPAPPAMGHNGGPPLQNSDELAEALEKDLNHYLTSVDRGYRADFDRMLFWVGFGGCGFRKVYNDPIKRMPLSRSVAADDLIVNNAEADFDDCRRITHRIKMRKSQLIRMQLAGIYRVAELATPIAGQDIMAEKIAETQGFNASNLRPEDNEYTIYECYCELDIEGFRHKDKDGNDTGLELPYRVTIEKDSRQVLEVRRNWREDDENCLSKKTFVKYPFVPAFGFYEIGLLQILGNATKALTGAWREALDAGMFANFPGFLYADAAGRQTTNEFRVPPGGGVKIQTGGKPISNVVMPLPYKEMGPGMMAFMQQVEVTAQRVGGTAELQVGEGKQDAPVGTTLAMIEQATKMLSAVHVRLHAAQSEEYQLLKERFREDPAALWRQNKRPAMAWTVDQFLDALDNYDLVPAADPNNPSHMQRIMKAIAVKQLQAMNPQLYNAAAVDRRILNMIGLTDIDGLFNPNPPPPADPNAGKNAQDPSKMAGIQLKAQMAQQQEQQHERDNEAKAANQQQQADARQRELAVESADRAADRTSREKVAQIREDTERLKVEGELQQHQQPSGDTIVAAHTDMAQHHIPSGESMLSAHSDIARHGKPSADALLGAHTDMRQHHAPSGDAQVAAEAAAAAAERPEPQPAARGGKIWERPI